MWSVLLASKHKHVSHCHDFIHKMLLLLILHKLTSGTEPTAPQMNQDLKIKLTDFYFWHHTAVSSGLHSNMASNTQESALSNPSLSPWFLTTLN